MVKHLFLLEAQNRKLFYSIIMLNNRAANNCHSMTSTTIRKIILPCQSQQGDEGACLLGGYCINNQFESSLGAQWPYYYSVCSSSLLFGFYTSEHRALTSSGEKNPWFSPYSGETSKVLFTAKTLSSSSQGRKMAILLKVFITHIGSYLTGKMPSGTKNMA